MLIEQAKMIVVFRLPAPAFDAKKNLRGTSEVDN